MHFDRMSTFEQKLIFGFGEDLNGVRLGAVSLFESEETKDIEAYNRWNFTSPELWDSTSTGFQYANTTHQLFQTEEGMIIGKQTTDIITIQLSTEEITRKG